MSRVEALVKRWRLHGATRMEHEQVIYERCADELEEALSAQSRQEDAWVGEVAGRVSRYGLSEEAAAVFAASEIDEYRAGECDCAELDPADLVDLTMEIAMGAVEKWKVESVGRPFGFKAPSAPVGVEWLASEWEKRAGELNDEGLYGCCAGVYEQCSERVRALAQQSAAVDYVPGVLDRTAPERIWLQIDTTTGNDDRAVPWPGSEHVTWQDESIGGLEIQYTRADLSAQPRQEVDADTLLSDYDTAVATLSAENETGWDEDGCATRYAQEVSRLRGLLLQRLQPQEKQKLLQAPASDGAP